MLSKPSVADSLTSGYTTVQTFWVGLGTHNPGHIRIPLPEGALLIASIPAPQTILGKKILELRVIFQRSGLKQYLGTKGFPERHIVFRDAILGTTKTNSYDVS